MGNDKTAFSCSANYFGTFMLMKEEADLEETWNDITDHMLLTLSTFSLSMVTLTIRSQNYLIFSFC